MKFKAPTTEWTDRIAWFPVRMNMGENDACRLVWLERYYVKKQVVMGRPELYIISFDDYKLRCEQFAQARREVDEEDRI